MTQGGDFSTASGMLYEAERAVLNAIKARDLRALKELLAPDFLVTTAGWIAEPADRDTWLAGLAEHQLDDFAIRVIAERSYGVVAVSLVESAQRGSRSGTPWAYTFRYTDVWRRDGSRWLLAVRHASVVR